MLCSVDRRSKTVISLFLFLVASSLSGANDEAATTSRKDAGDASVTLKVNSDLVQIPVTVTDKSDRVIANLPKESFAIFENGVEQRLVHFGSGEAPVSLCIVFDTSSSMGNKLRKSIEALNEILETAVSGDEYCLVRFSERPEIVAPIALGPAAVASATGRIYSGGSTALLDAIGVGIQEVRRGNNRHKAIALISDGGDNRSIHTQRETEELVRQADVQIFSVGIVGRDTHMSSREEINGPALMKSISRESGGSYFCIHEVTELAAAIDKLNTELRYQYVLGYYSKSDRDDGKYRHVKVKIHPPRGTPSIRASWRTGYYAPHR